MKKFSLLSLCVAAALTAASAQTPTPTPESRPVAPTMDGNYVLTLYPPVEKKGNPEIAVIVALTVFDKARDSAELYTTFDAENNNPTHIHFRGSLAPQKDGLYLLRYFLENSGGTISTEILLRPGEPVQIIKNGDLFYNLRLERYNAPSLR